MTNNPPHDLHSFMKQVTDEMASEYDRIFARSLEDPGTAGDQGEGNWASLLREWLPPSYQVVTKGRLISAEGRMSPQIDVLVLKPFYPQKLREKNVWLANGVAAAFECKTTLRRSHILESAKRCKEFKALYERRSGTPASELLSPLVYGILAHSHDWKDKSSEPAKNIDNALEKANEFPKHPVETLDVLCVADVGCWSKLITLKYESHWRPSDKKQLEATFGGQWGPVSSMIRSSKEQEAQTSKFQPIGGMLAYVTNRLARNDPTLRDLADYYRAANLWGNGSGYMRFWPQSSYSLEVQKKLEDGFFLNGDLWSDWSIALM